MKKCPKCNKEHDNTGVHCTRSCANSRVFSEESRLKKSLALKGKARSGPYRTKKQIQKWVASIKESRLKKYLNTSFDQLGPENRRRRVFEDQEFKCNKCGIDNWLGKKLSLELEHKDGNNKNNKRKNLEGLCPNCHSLTPTWRGRNKK